MPLLPGYFPALCPKLEGDTLQRMIPSVCEMYGEGTLRGHATKLDVVRIRHQVSVLRRDVGRSQPWRKIGHMTLHTIPCRTPLRLVVLALSALLWLLLLPLDLKLRCILCGLLYSGMEFTFTLLERGAPYTSFAQFWGNLLYLPLLLDVYGYFLSASPALYVLCFPLNIWVLELVLGSVFWWVYGHNVAWNYLDYADAYCSGCIRVGHGLFWLVLGVVCFTAYPTLCEATRVIADPLTQFF